MDEFLGNNQEPSPFVGATPHGAEDNPISVGNPAPYKAQAALLALSNKTYEQAQAAFQNFDAEAPDALKKLMMQTQAQGAEAVQQFKDNLPQVMADPTVSIQEKENIVDNLRSGKIKTPDSTSTLVASSAAKENGLAHDSYADGVNGWVNIQALSDDSWMKFGERQAAVNLSNAYKDGTVQKIGDFLGLFAPLADANMTLELRKSPIAQELGMGGRLYASMLPGSFMQEMVGKLNELPYEKKTAALASIKDIIRSGSSLATSDNQMRAESFMSDLNSEDYGSFEKWMTNGFHYLDIIGVGQGIKNAPTFIRKGIAATKSGVNSLKGAEEITNAIKFERAGRDIPFDAAVATARPDVDTTRVSAGVTQNDLAKNTQVPQRSINQAKIEQLETQRTTILEEPTDPLGPREVTRLEGERKALAQKLEASRAMPVDGKKGGTSLSLKKVHNDVLADMESQINRIDDALQTNRVANNNAQVLADIDKELDGLRKGKDMEAIPETPLAQAINQAYVQGTVFNHNPRTVGHILMNTNPNEARNLQMATLLDEGGETALALHGVGRDEALAKGVMPQVSTAGTVKWITPDIDKGIRTRLIDPKIDDIVADATGGYQFTPGELATGRANIVHEYENAVGIQLHPAMSHVKTSEDGSRLYVQGIYTAGDTGWATAEDAIAQTKFALSKRGIGDNDITVFARQGDEFVPVDKASVAGVQGEYVIGIRTEDIVNAGDIGPLEALDVKYNFMDRFNGSGQNKYGSLQTHIIPSANMLHETITGAAAVADDKVSALAKFLLDKLDDFSTPYMQLNAGRREKMADYFVEANTKGLAPDPQDLIARGFTTKEQDIIGKWRNYWDTNFELENLDVVRNLRGQNYGWLQSGNLSTAIKMPTKRPNYGITEIYDATHDVVRPIDAQEIKDLYNSGGYIAEVRRPFDLQGQMVENVIVRQNANEYSRNLKDTDKVLEKREGYFQVHHKGAKYVDETFQGPSGKTYTRTVAVSGTTQEAKEATELLRKRNPGKEYSYRGDERGISRGSQEYWDLNSVGGRIAQRHRSSLLEESTGLQSVTNGMTYIQNPVESALRAAQSISGRTAMRPVLETSKKRFMDQYAHLVTADEMGQRHFPSSLNGIAQKGEFSKKELADARTTWNYINYLENGYVNSLDNGVKAIMRLAADFTGEMGLGKVEGAFRAGEEVNLTAKAKGVMFGSFFATNPFRQWVMQGNQSLRAMAYNPKGFVSGSIFEYFRTPFHEATKGSLTANQLGFKEFMENTGMYQAISKNNVIRGTMMDAAERRGYTGKLTDGAISTLRRVGFDVGEHFNLWVHGASVYDEFVRAGKNVKDARVQAEMHSRIRAITYDMNFAGDMPYNQNAASLFMTYMQVPHKALASGFNRRVPLDVRMRMAMFDVALWGIPEPLAKMALGETYKDMDEETQRLMYDGLESWFINKLLETAADERVAIDFSPLKPYDMDSWVKLFEAGWSDGGLSKVLGNSANGRMFTDGNGRVWQAVKLTMDYFKDIRDDSNSIDPANLWQVANAWASISSGWSNAQKARARWALQYATDKKGGRVDDYVNKYEAAAMMFGFGTEDERQYYKTIMDQNKDMKATKEAAVKDADEFIRLVQLKSNGMADPREVAKMHMQLMRTHANHLNPAARDAYMKEATENLFKPANYKVLESLSKNNGLFDSTDYLARVKAAPISEDKKKLIIDQYLGGREATKAMGHGPQQ